MADRNRPERPENDLPRRERAEVEELRDWETIQKNGGDQTQRLMIANGWLYRTITNAGQVALVFVARSGDE